VLLVSIDIFPFHDEQIADAGVLLAERHRHDRFSLPGLPARFWPRQGFRPIAYRLVRRVDQRIAWANLSQMAISL
jgi:hypothetical protein